MIHTLPNGFLLIRPGNETNESIVKIVGKIRMKSNGKVVPFILVLTKENGFSIPGIRNMFSKFPKVYKTPRIIDNGKHT